MQIMADARNISRDFHAVGQTDAGDFAQRRVRLFRSGGGNLNADALLERRPGGGNGFPAVQSIVGQMQSDGLHFFPLAVPSFSDKLINCRHKN